MFKSSFIILSKEIRSELRTRYVLNALVMFVLVTVSIIKFSIGDEPVDNEILTGLLWIVIFFSASGALSRIFVKEEEKETSSTLKLVSSPTPVFLGKLFFNALLTFLLNIFIIILFILITDYKIGNVSGFILVLLLGNIGLVSSSTIIAAIISKANSKGTLYPVLSFPVLLPLLLSVINATKLASSGAATAHLMQEIQILFSYDVVVTTAALMLFRFIWEE